MKKSKRLLALSLAAVMAAGMLTGCGNAKKTDATLQETTVQAQEETTEKEETKEETLAEVSKEREITDMAGRTMTIPAEIKSVFSAGSASRMELRIERGRKKRNSGTVSQHSQLRYGRCSEL